MFSKKILLLAASAVMLLSTGSFALPADWSGDGWVSQIYVGSGSAYGTGVDPTCVFSLTGGTGVAMFAFPVNTDLGKALLSQLYAAKFSGVKVQVANDAKGNWGYYPLVDRFVNLQ